MTQALFVWQENPYCSLVQSTPRRASPVICLDRVTPDFRVPGEGLFSADRINSSRTRKRPFFPVGCSPPVWSRPFPAFCRRQCFSRPHRSRASEVPCVWSRNPPRFSGFPSWGHFPDRQARGGRKPWPSGRFRLSRPRIPQLSYCLSCSRCPSGSFSLVSYWQNYKIRRIKKKSSSAAAVWWAATCNNSGQKYLKTPNEVFHEFYVYDTIKQR